MRRATQHCRPPVDRTLYGHAYEITCLTCRNLSILESIDLDRGMSGGVSWIRLTMGCGHTPSLPERHRTAIERMAIGTSAGFAFTDPDGRATFMARSANPAL